MAEPKDIKVGDWVRYEYVNEGGHTELRIGEVRRVVSNVSMVDIGYEDTAFFVQIKEVRRG